MYISNYDIAQKMHLSVKSKHHKAMQLERLL